MATPAPTPTHSFWSGRFLTIQMLVQITYGQNLTDQFDLAGDLDEFFFTVSARMMS